jgi:hypothetical protein
MLSNATLQSSVKHAILGTGATDLAPEFATCGFDPLRRFNIYRNNTFASLTATLLSVFPVTASLLGDGYFRFVAAGFIKGNAPTEPRLVRYGANFAGFLGRLDDLRSMPFVADVARLEWLIAEALDAPLAQPRLLAELTARDAATMPEVRLQPSLRLLFARWPALDIWSAHQPGGDLDSLARVRRQPERIALWRSSDSVRFLRLGSAHYAFLHALVKQRGLETAVGRAVARSADIDLAATLHGLFADGLVASIRHLPVNPAH